MPSSIRNAGTPDYKSVLTPRRCRHLAATQPISRHGSTRVSSPLADWAGTQLRRRLLEAPASSGFSPLVQHATTGTASQGTAHKATVHTQQQAQDPQLPGTGAAQAPEQPSAMPPPQGTAPTTSPQLPHSSQPDPQPQPKIAAADSAQILAALLPQPGSAAWERRVGQLAHALASLPDSAHALQMGPAACTAALLQGLVSTLLTMEAPAFQAPGGVAGLPVAEGCQGIGLTHQGEAALAFCGQVRAVPLQRRALTGATPFPM